MAPLAGRQNERAIGTGPALPATEEAAIEGAMVNNSMDTRRVAFLTPMHFDEQSYLGGGERYPVNLAYGVVGASNGTVEIDIISYGASARSVELSPGVRLKVLTLANPGSNPLDALSWELPAAIADADLVHVHQAFTRSSEIALLVAKQQQKPICVTDHGGATSRLASSLKSLDLADRIICYSDFGASLIEAATQINVVKGGVNAEFFQPPVASPQRDHVLYVGRLMPHKGIDQLVAALPAGIPLIVCGRPYDRDYHRFLETLATGKDVRFLTEAGDEEIRELYRTAWATVLPSVYIDCNKAVHLAPELMGLSMLESMACGTPAICSRVAAMPEFIRHRETGFVYDSLAELTGHLELLATNSEVCDQMGARARADIDERFSREVVGRRVLSIYEELIEDRVPVQ